MTTDKDLVRRMVHDARLEELVCRSTPTSAEIHDMAVELINSRAAIEALTSELAEREKERDEALSSVTHIRDAFDLAVEWKSRAIAAGARIKALEDALRARENDIGVLIATIREFAEAVAESLDPDDEQIVSEIECEHTQRRRAAATLGGQKQ